MTRPNFLFIVADDLNAWIGALGRNPDVKTPNIDRLASRGTLFTEAYCPAPYCNASRMSVFTGRAPATTGVYVNEPLLTRAERPATLFEILKQAGYYTWGAGKVFHGRFNYTAATRERASEAKWSDLENHAGLWDKFYGNQTDPLPLQRPLNGLFTVDEFSSVSSNYQLFDWGPMPADRESRMPDEAVVREVGAFVSPRQQPPFFCAAGLYKPHLPWHVPERFFQLYDRERISLPPVKDDDLDDVPPIARKWALSPPDHQLVTSKGQWRHAVQAYLAAVSYCDYQVGRIVETLDSGPNADSTWVILWGDNGFHLGEKLHWRKFVLWEEATRVPLIIVPPRSLALAPSQCHGPVSLMDIFPTILAAAGVSEQQSEGASLLPAVHGERIARHRPVLMTWLKGNHSIRSGDWRYTRYSDGTTELYDHRADPYEWRNLADDPNYRSRASALTLELTSALPSSP